MPNNNQKFYNTAAGIFLIAAAIMDVINFIDMMKAIHEMNKYKQYGISVPWQIWAAAIALGATVALMAASGLFILMQKNDLYSKGMMLLGIATIVMYFVVVEYLFSMASGTTYGSYMVKELLRWPYILVYGSMLCFGLCYILAGVYAKKAEEEPTRGGTNWLQGLLTYLAAIGFLIIAAMGLGKSPLGLLSTTDSETWLQVTRISLPFLILLFSGLHFKSVEEAGVLAEARSSGPNVVPAAPFGYPQRPNGPGYGAQGYGAQQAERKIEMPVKNEGDGNQTESSKETVSLGTFEALQEYGRNQGYGKQDVDLDPLKDFFQPMDLDADDKKTE